MKTAIRRWFDAMVIIAFVPFGCSAADKPVEWDHGFKTPYVVATRYKNPNIGQNIGFSFPKNPNDSDREELVKFMEQHNGWVYQCGGYPGAEMFVKFSDVTDKETASKKIQELLPELSKLIRSL